MKKETFFSPFISKFSLAFKIKMKNTVQNAIYLIYNNLILVEKIWIFISNQEIPTNSPNSR